MNDPATGAAAWAERYESLRAYILSERPRFPNPPLGLTLWLAKGMAGWMRQWRELTPATAPPSSPAARFSGPLTGPWQQQLTLLLAQMTLANLQPQARHASRI
jgi:hypothetical protein